LTQLKTTLTVVSIITGHLNTQLGLVGSGEQNNSQVIDYGRVKGMQNFNLGYKWHFTERLQLQ